MTQYNLILMFNKTATLKTSMELGEKATLDPSLYGFYFQKAQLSRNRKSQQKLASSKRVLNFTHHSFVHSDLRKWLHCPKAMTLWKRSVSSPNGDYHLHTYINTGFSAIKTDKKTLYGTTSTCRHSPHIAKKHFSVNLNCDQGIQIGDEYKFLTFKKIC